MTQANQSAAANRRPAGQLDGSDNLAAIVAADRAFPAAVAGGMTLMKNRYIIGIGVAGLIASILGGYYFWVIVSIAALIPGSGDNHNGQAWFWFVTCCAGIVLLFTSIVSFFVSGNRRTHNHHV